MPMQSHFVWMHCSAFKKLQYISQWINSRTCMRNGFKKKQKNKLKQHNTRKKTCAWLCKKTITRTLWYFVCFVLLFLILGCLLILHAKRSSQWSTSLHELIRYFIPLFFEMFYNVWHIPGGGGFLSSTVWFCHKQIFMEHGGTTEASKPAPSKHPKARALFKKYGGNWNSYLHGQRKWKQDMLHGTSWTWCKEKSLFFFALVRRWTVENT